MVDTEKVLDEVKRISPDVYRRASCAAYKVPKPMPLLHRFTELINAYCMVNGIEISSFTNNPNGRRAIGEAKKGLYAVLLYILHPLKLYGIANTHYPELTARLMNFTGDSEGNISMQVSDAIGYFKVYINFRERTIKTAKDIVEMMK